MKNLFIFILCLGYFVHVSAPLQAQMRAVRALPSFSAVKIQGEFLVELIPGTSEKIEISSTKIDPEKIIAKLNKQGELVIRLERNNLYQSIKHLSTDVFWEGVGVIKLRITYQRLRSIARSGSGWAKVSQPLVSAHFSIRNSGSGDVYVTAFSGKYLEASSSGSGKIIVAKGTTERQELSVSGSGKIDNLGLASLHTECSVSGSGQVFVRVSERLEASVSGTGQVRYLGKPANLEQSISGSGSVEPQ